MTFDVSPMPLFAFAPPAQACPTSRAAAKSVAHCSRTDRQFVLAAIQRAKSYGATDDELQDILAMNPSTERPRRIELVNAGLVADSGFVRKTKSGRKAVVWIAVQ